MASSSKRGTSRKQGSGGKARVISAKRKDALPRQGNVSAGGQRTETTTARAKTKRAGRGASGKLNETAALEVGVLEAEVEVEASAIVEETTIGEVPFAPPAEAVKFPSPTPAAPAPAVPAPHDGKRAVMTIVSRLVSTLCRWAGVRP